MWTHHVLKAGYQLTATVVDGKGFCRQQDYHAIGGLITNSAPREFGPYAIDRVFETQGDVTVVIAEADLIGAIPKADQEDGATVFNDAGALKVSTAAE